MGKYLRQNAGCTTKLLASARSEHRHSHFLPPKKLFLVDKSAKEPLGVFHRIFMPTRGFGACCKAQTRFMLGCKAIRQPIQGKQICLGQGQPMRIQRNGCMKYGKIWVPGFPERSLCSYSCPQAKPMLTLERGLLQHNPVTFNMPSDLLDRLLTEQIQHVGSFLNRQGS